MLVLLMLIISIKAWKLKCFIKLNSFTILIQNFGYVNNFYFKTFDNKNLYFIDYLFKFPKIGSSETGSFYDNNQIICIKWI